MFDPKDKTIISKKTVVKVYTTIHFVRNDRGYGNETFEEINYQQDLPDDYGEVLFDIINATNKTKVTIVDYTKEGSHGPAKR